jgi:hypothetical protein
MVANIYKKYRHKVTKPADTDIDLTDSLTATDLYHIQYAYTYLSYSSKLKGMIFDTFAKSGSLVQQREDQQDRSAYGDLSNDSFDTPHFTERYLDRG